MKISPLRASPSRNEDKRQLVTSSVRRDGRGKGGGGFPSASSERATHVVGAKAIFSGRQISPGPPTSASRRRSLGYLISGCAPCRCVDPAARNQDRAFLAWCIYNTSIYISFFSKRYISLFEYRHYLRLVPISFWFSTRKTLVSQVLIYRSSRIINFLPHSTNCILLNSRFNEIIDIIENAGSMRIHCFVDLYQINR